MAVAFEDWMLALAALIFGVGIGWLFWGGRPPAETKPQSSGTAAEGGKAGPPTDANAAAPNSEPGNFPSTIDLEKLSGIERELKDARELLTEGEEELRLFGDEIAELDSALERANASLKLLIREIRRRSPGAGAEEDGDA